MASPALENKFLETGGATTAPENKLLSLIHVIDPCRNALRRSHGIGHHRNHYITVLLFSLSLRFSPTHHVSPPRPWHHRHRHLASPPHHLPRRPPQAARHRSLRLLCGAPAWRGGAAGLARRAGGGGAEPRHGGAPGQLADAGAVQAPGLADLLPHRVPCQRGRKRPAVDAVAPSLLSDASDAPFKATNKR